MSTRRRPRSEREPAMLVAATDAFARHGYAGVSMEEIASECGITKPMLYRYFGSKEGLYLACLERSGAELVGVIATAAGPPVQVEPGERLRRGFLAFFSFVDAQQVGWSMLFDTSTTIPATVARGVLELRAQLAAMLETALSDPDLELRAARAHALIGAGEALANWWLAHPDQAPEALAELFVSLWTG